MAAAERDPLPLPAITAAVFRALLPRAERREVLDDLAEEFTGRARTRGRLAARLWLWNQLAASIPALVRRGWWRGWTGFEPRANRFEPGGPMFETWIMDARYSARRLAARPAYALLAVLTLGLGAGGTAAIFSIVRELLVEPLPVAREQEIGVLWFDGSWNEAEFLYLRPDFPGFERMAAYRPADATLDLAGQPLRLVRGIAASAELFDVLGTAPLIGRTFQPGDDRPGAERVAVLSHSLWQDLGGSQAILGRTLQLGGVAYTVVGVMPRGFWFPNPATRVWTATPLDPQRRAGVYTLIGRVASGHRIDAMQDALASIARSLSGRFQYPPQWDKTRAPAITALREFLVGDVRPGLFAALAAMALILGIACVNVTALMLGQLGSRSTELAVRSALGAGRQRLVQQLVIESLLIGALAGAAGAAIAASSFAILARSLPLGALAESATLDWTVFWAAFGFALIAASLAAVVPAMALRRTDLRGTMATTRTAGISLRGGRLEGTLVVAQIAVAVVLAAAAGLLIRSVANLRGLDPGMRVSGVAVVDATMPSQLPHDARLRVVLDALPVLQALPGVSAAAATQKLPLRGSGDNFGIAVVGRPELANTTTALRMVTHDYFRAIGAQIVRGRNFDSSDRATTEPVVIINEALAAKYFPGEEPLGRLLSSGFGDQQERIIGVVENLAEADLTDAPVPARYMLYEHMPIVSYEVSFVLSASPEDIPRVLDAARAALQAPATRLALQRTTTMEAVLDEAVGAPGRVATLLTLLAGLALVLGAIGVYGVISHFVGRRARDYGIHIALGLPPERVVRQVVGRGVGLAALGCLAGVAATLAFTGPLSSLLYGVSRADPAALSGAVLALIVVGAVAAFLPARRASRTDPAVVLRQQ